MELSGNARIFFLAAGALGVVTGLWSTDLRAPGNDRGYAPEQPIAFSHRLHAGEMGMDCQYCHYGARWSRHAGIPPTGLCMNCHTTVTTSLDVMEAERQAATEENREPRTIISEELGKLYDYLALDEERKPRPDATPRPVPWVRVHKLPDFAYFDHRPHVRRGIRCQQCHGPVAGMERMQQFADLTMGWCLDCHRSTPQDPSASLEGLDSHGRHLASVSTDCSTCHM